MSKNAQTTTLKTEQTIQTAEQGTSPQAQPATGVLRLQDGNSPVAIIMAISVLIGALGGLIKVLVPVMLGQQDKKAK